MHILTYVATHKSQETSYLHVTAGPRAININIITATRDGLSTTGSCSLFHGHQWCRVHGPILCGVIIEINFNGLGPTITVGVINVDGNMSGTKGKCKICYEMYIKYVCEGWDRL